MTRHFVLLLACVVVCGCNRPKLGGVPVSGTVSYRNQPLKGGTVSFHPVDPGQTRPATAKINSDGAYSAGMLQNEPGLMPGEYRVSVFALDRPLYESAPSQQRDIASQIPGKYSSPETSGIVLTVPDDGAGVQYDIALDD